MWYVPSLAAAHVVTRLTRLLHPPHHNNNAGILLMMCAKYLEDDEAAMQLRLMRTLSQTGSGHPPRESIR
jgi:hypothetical protein